MQQTGVDQIVAEACAEQQAITNSATSSDKLRSLYNAIVPAHQRSSISFAAFRRQHIAQQEQRQ